MPTLPILTAAIVTDSDALAAVIERVLLRSDDYRRLSDRIRRHQVRLRRLVRGDDAWKAYLQLEEAVNERAVAIAEVLVRWSFEAGVRAGSYY